MADDVVQTAAPIQTLAGLPVGVRVMLPFRFSSPPVLVSFPAANVNREVLHLCPQVPDGFIQLDSPEGARLCRAPAMAWGAQTAWLQSDKANSTAVVIFVNYREAVHNVQPTT